MSNDSPDGKSTSPPTNIKKTVVTNHPSYDNSKASAALTQKLKYNYDERCITRCRQTGRGRLTNEKPVCWCICYINMREFMKHMQQNKLSFKNPERTKEFLANKDHRYNFSFLRNRVIYYAEGTETVASHMVNMNNHSMFEKLHEQKKKDKELADQPPPSRDELIEQRLKAKQETYKQEDFERYYPMDEVIQSKLQAVEDHFVRILGPMYRTMFERIPKAYNNGAHYKLIGKLQENISNGDPFKLGQRSLSSSIEVLNKIAVSKGWKSDGEEQGPSN